MRDRKFMTRVNVESQVMVLVETKACQAMVPVETRETQTFPPRRSPMKERMKLKEAVFRVMQQRPHRALSAHTAPERVLETMTALLPDEDLDHHFFSLMHHNAEDVSRYKHGHLLEYGHVNITGTSRARFKTLPHLITSKESHAVRAKAPHARMMMIMEERQRQTTATMAQTDKTLDVGRSTSANSTIGRLEEGEKEAEADVGEGRSRHIHDNDTNGHSLSTPRRPEKHRNHARTRENHPKTNLLFQHSHNASKEGALSSPSSSSTSSQSSPSASSFSRRLPKDWHAHIRIPSVLERQVKEEHERQSKLPQQQTHRLEKWDLSSVEPNMLQQYPILYPLTKSKPSCE